MTPGGSSGQGLQAWTIGNINDTLKVKQDNSALLVPSDQEGGGSDSEEVVVLPFLDTLDSG